MTTLISRLPISVGNVPVNTSYAVVVDTKSNNKDIVQLNVVAPFEKEWWMVATIKTFEEPEEFSAFLRSRYVQGRPVCSHKPSSVMHIP